MPSYSARFHVIFIVNINGIVMPGPRTHASQHLIVTPLTFLGKISENSCGAGTSGTWSPGVSRVPARKKEIFRGKSRGAEKICG
jgi:hypothetical protein